MTENGSTSENMKLDPERGWIPAVPITTQWIRVERWCSRHRLGAVARLMAWWDERGLG